MNAIVYLLTFALPHAGPAADVMGPMPVEVCRQLASEPGIGETLTCIEASQIQSALVARSCKLSDADYNNLTPVIRYTCKG